MTEIVACNAVFKSLRKFRNARILRHGLNGLKVDCLCCTVVRADYGYLLPRVINGLFLLIELVGGLVHSKKNKLLCSLYTP
jgi:hypothetical protein